MRLLLRVGFLSCCLAVPASAATFSFTTGSPDGRMATTSRPAVGPVIEIESADDFILTSTTSITGATFTGLLPSGAALTSVSEVDVEIYRGFPLDSTNPPSGHVLTRTNSPSDVAFDSRSSGSTLTFTSTLINASFTAVNSVVSGIHAVPNQRTNGEGAVNGEEVVFTVTFTTPFLLPKGHYFFVPQVALTGGNFLWLSAARPQFTGDLQEWIRDANLAPDWLRVGTDIVGGTVPPTFNCVFSLSGTSYPRGDFNGDGNSDLVLQTSADDSISNWFMSGLAPIQGQQLGTPTGWSPVALADLDGDGHADIVLQNRATGDVAAWIIDASGAFVKGVYLIASPGPTWSVRTAADFNHDHTDDLVLQDSSTGAVVIWLMQGATILSGQTVATPKPEYVVMGSGDFDNDGNVDLLLQSSVTNAVVIWKMNGTSIISGQTIATPVAGWQVIAAGDFDGNGEADVLLQNSISFDITVWIMNGFAITAGHVIASPGAGWICKGRGDFNGDGTDDVVIQNSSTKQVIVYQMSGGFVSTTGSPIAPANTYTLMISR